MVEVVSHRGAAALEPENTLPGFRRAVELGADWTECDVHLTADGHLVVIHDETVDRTTDGTGRVGEMTLEEIRALNAGNGARVPTPAEVLGVVRERIRLQVELKGEGVEAAALRAVQSQDMLGQVLFTSFHLERLQRVKEIEPTAEVAALFAEPPADAVGRALDAGAGSLHVLYRNLTWGLVEDAHEAGLQVGAWNPDAEPEWRAMLALGIDVLSTNRTDALLRMLGRL